jgi:hypothetical protein
MGAPGGVVILQEPWKRDDVLARKLDSSKTTLRER